MAYQLFNSITYKELYLTLKSIMEEDVYLDDCFYTGNVEEFVYLLETYNLIWITSDGRLLTTQKGEKVFDHLIKSVVLSKNHEKITI